MATECDWKPFPYLFLVPHNAFCPYNAKGSGSAESTSTS